MTEEQLSKDCVEYGKKLDELQSILKQQAPYLDNVKNIVGEIQAIKLPKVSGKPAESSPQLKAALAAAKKTSRKFGADSPEARVAWSEVEEIAASGLENSMGTNLAEECLVDSAMEACMALEELNRVMNLQKTRTEGLGDF